MSKQLTFLLLLLHRVKPEYKQSKNQYLITIIITIDIKVVVCCQLINIFLASKKRACPVYRQPLCWNIQLMFHFF